MAKLSWSEEPVCRTVKPGVANCKSTWVSIRCSASASGAMAVTATGTSCSRSVVRRAVTTIDCISVASAAVSARAGAAIRYAAAVAINATITSATVAHLLSPFDAIRFMRSPICISFGHGSKHSYNKQLFVFFKVCRNVLELSTRVESGRRGKIGRSTFCQASTADRSNYRAVRDALTTRRQRLQAFEASLRAPGHHRIPISLAMMLR
jgi:hypothetical protein